MNKSEPLAVIIHPRHSVWEVWSATKEVDSIYGRNVLRGTVARHRDAKILADTINELALLDALSKEDT